MAKTPKSADPALEPERVNVICMKWGTKYGPESVNRLYKGVQRHLKRPHRFAHVDDVRSRVLRGRDDAGVYAAL